MSGRGVVARGRGRLRTRRAGGGRGRLLRALPGDARRGGPLASVPFPGAPLRPVPARVASGGRAEIGPLNAAICALLGRGAGGGEAPRVFTTLARHRRLFRPWLRFAARLMPFGTLPRADAELVILRVAVLCGSDYEWRQHVALAQRAGLTAELIARIGDGAAADGWSERQRALLRAADELVLERTLSAAAWDALIAAGLDERQRIELCLLAGHYAMLAGTLNALGVEPEGAGGAPGASAASGASGGSAGAGGGSAGAGGGSAGAASGASGGNAGESADESG